MKPHFLQNQTSRRDILRGSVTLASGAFLMNLLPAPLLRAATTLAPGPTAADLRAKMRAWFNAFPLETKKLADNITMLSGPGGSVVVLNGPDGKFLVDCFVAPAWPRLRNALDGLGNAPVKYVVNTHWHFDHVDNNAPLHAAGATVLAQENTKKRMSETHVLPALYRGEDGKLYDVQFDPSPSEALPQETFANEYTLQANGETLALEHFAASHTDGDIYAHFRNADVISMGDLFFNGSYAYIDAGTGGNITGVIAAVDKILSIAGNDTKIVPGHGPLGNRSDLRKFRDMLVTARDRVGRLKSAGKSIQEAVAEKPFADLEPVWGKGVINGDQFVQIVYLTL